MDNTHKAAWKNLFPRPWLFCGALLALTVSSIGAETLKIREEEQMKPFMEPWIAAFQQSHPDVKFEVTRGHWKPENRSSIGADEELLFRINDKEFFQKYGYSPFSICVSSGGKHIIGTIAALGVYVHPSNPIKSLTLNQIQAIYSAAPLDGRPIVSKWGELGLTGEWADRPINAYGRETHQGASNYFVNRALGGVGYNKRYQALKNTTVIIETVAKDVAGIGYAAISYETPLVKSVGLAEKDGAVTGQANYADVASLKYPLSYPLFISINRVPGQPLSPATKAFLKYALSKEGQQAVAISGYLPLPQEIVEMELSKLDL
ncbi:MAG: substrate-binding domain-containing protein [Opitutaceae bacterium]|nr:substrate-binding domain-containing protein [Opitutaceae bacterium]